MANDKGHSLSQEDLEKALELLRAGHRQVTIAKYFGVSSVAFFNRREADPEYGRKWSRADAEGEIATRAAMQEAANKGLSTAPYQWVLEHRYGWTSPINRARIEELRARTAASKAMSSPESAQAYRQIVADLLTRRPGSPPPDVPQAAPQEDQDADP